MLAFWALVALLALVSDRHLTGRAEWVRENDYVNASNYRRIRSGPVGQLLPQIRLPARSTHPVQILAVGDSLVWGDGAMDLDTRWPAQLERVLNARAGAGTFRVISLGQNGASTADEARWLSPRALARLRPDLVIVGVVDNDAVPPGRRGGTCAGALCQGIGQIETTSQYESCRRGNAAGLPWLGLHVIRRAFPSLADDLMHKECDAWAHRNASRRLGYPYGRWLAETQSRASLRVYRATATGLARRLRDTPALILPTPLNVADTAWLTQPLALLREAGLSKVRPTQTTALLRRSSTEDLKINPVNGHPSPPLTEAYASDAASAILALSPVRTALTRNKSAPRAGPPTFWASNFLPVELRVQNRTSGFSVLSNGKPRVGSTTQLAGTPLPPQYAPCKLLGRPYAEVGLGASQADPATRTIKLRMAFGPRMDVFSLRYPNAGGSRISRLGSVDPRRTTTARFDPRPPVALLFAPGSDGSCDLSASPRLPAFGITIDAR